MIDLDELVVSEPRLTGGKSYRQVLVDARKLIEDESRWTQGAFARRADGEAVKPLDPAACRHCLVGAIAKSSNEHGIVSPVLMNYLHQSVRSRYGTYVDEETGEESDMFPNVGNMNDYVTHQAVLLFLDECIMRFDR